MADDPAPGAPAHSRKAPSKEVAGDEKPVKFWLIPAITAAVLASAFCLYYFVYVAAQREYLANRNFRSLAVLGAQVQEMVSIHGSILEFAADLADPTRKHDRKDRQELTEFLFVRAEDRSLPRDEKEKETRKDYLNYLSPGFHLTEIAVEAGIKPLRSASRFEVRRHNGRWELVLTAQRHNGTKKDFIGSLEIDNMLKIFVGSLPFDGIMLASEKGTIVYQSNKSGPQFTTLTSLLQTQTDGAPVKPAGEKADAQAGSDDHEGNEVDAGVDRNADKTWRSKSKQLTDVAIAGTRYKLFLQPILVDVFSDEPDRSEPAHEWVLCGLSSARALDWEALSISSTFIIWFTALFLAVCLSGPVLKILFINHREHFRLRELGLLGLSLVLLTCVFTLSGLEAIVFPRNDNTDTELQDLGDRLSGNIHQELSDMRKQLKDWCGNKLLKGDLELTKTLGQVIRHAPAPNGNEKQKKDNTITPEAGFYPYLNNAFWTDDDGNQIVKWSASNYLTPMIDVSQLTFFTQPVSTYLDGKGPPFRFDSLRPPNKLEYLAGLTMATRDCDSALSGLPADLAGGTASLTAQPMSLIDPILPFGYGFALLDESGTVLFHSDKTRNLHENFLQESGGSRQLYAAEFGHSTGRSLRVKYMGKDYEARVTPVKGVTQAPWSLVVYRDLTSVRTFNLQAMTMASTLLIMIFAAPVIVIAIWCAIRRPRFAPEWLWPNQARIRTYEYQVVIYSSLILLFLLLGFTGSVEQNVWSCFLIPYAALLLTVLCFRILPPAHPALPQSGSGPVKSPDIWRKYYFLSIALMLFIVGVLTPMVLFRASLNVERRLGIKQAQLHLASALGQRLISIRESCERHELSEAACKEFRTGDSAIWGRIVLDPLFLNDSKLLVKAHVSLRKGGELYPGWFRDLVYALHHDYNQSAAEMLGVIPDRVASDLATSDPTALATPNFPDWAWENDGANMTLRWHGVHLPDGIAHDVEEDLLIRSTATAPSWMDAFTGAAVASGVMAAIGLVLWVIIRKIFLFHVIPVNMTEGRRAIEYIREGRNVAILLPPVSNWNIDAQKWTLDLREFATGPKWAELLDLDKVPLNTLIEIRNFEYSANDAETDNQKFTLLERLRQREHTQVAVVMTVAASPEDYRRVFKNLEVVDLREEPFYWLKQYEGPARNLRARDLIWNECGPLAALWPIGAQLARDIKPGDNPTEETVAAEILERADAWYRLLWKECSNNQKFALAQLAQDGLLNPASGRAIRQLAGKGLVTEDPQFRIMNESFRRFLLSHTSAELKREWVRESRRSGWGKMHGAFFTTMLLLGVFLLTTQNELWQSSAAYVTTALGALGTLTKVFNTYRGVGSAEKEG
jgi:hypothetical protein